MSSLESPLVDLTTLNAVESLYHHGPGDPHGLELAGQLGEMIAYAREIRYPLPFRQDRAPNIPGFVLSLASRHGQLLKAIPFSTDDPVFLAPQHIGSALQQFLHWSNAHSTSLAKTITFHSQDWIRNAHNSRVRRNFVYDIDVIRERAEIALLGRLLNCSEAMLLFTFDLALRYSLYGDLAVGHQYLAHPVRDAVRLPTQEEVGAPPWQPCVSFADDIKAAARQLSMDDFVAFLCELRGQVHLYSLHKLAPGDVDVDIVRKIAETLGLQARFKHVARVLGVAAGALGAVGGASVAIPEVSGTAACLGGMVAVASAVWVGHAPRQFGKMKWLRWMLQFDAEDRAGSR